MTTDELLAIARADKPNVRYAAHRDGNSIAAFSEQLGRFVAVAGRDFKGRWYAHENELLIDGKPVYSDEDWK